MICIICHEEMEVWHFVISSIAFPPCGGWISGACTRLCRLGLFFSFLHCTVITCLGIFTFLFDIHMTVWVV